MSKIALSGNAAGTGTFTLAAPNSNTNRTLTLPDEAGTVLTNSSNIEAQVKTATNASGSAPIYACRAWVNFNGTGTVAIRASGNVSSITDVGVGDYTVNFTTAMPDANYAVVATTDNSVTNGPLAYRDSISAADASGSVRVATLNTAAARIDNARVYVAIFR